MVEAMREKVKRSLMSLCAQTFHRRSSSQEPFEECLGSNKQNDNALQYLHDVLGYVFGKAVDINAAVLQCCKQQRREDHTHRMVATEQCYGDTSETVVIREAV